MGAALRQPDTGEPAELSRQADFALYIAKQGGKGRYQRFDAEGSDRMAQRAAIRADLATAVAMQQLQLDYQPVAELCSGEIVGVEALVRWNHPTLGLLQPAEFIPLAEETGDIEAIGRWVLGTASRQAASWRAAMSHCGDLWVSINLSTLQLPSPLNLAAIETILRDPASLADLPADILKIDRSFLSGDADDAPSAALLEGIVGLAHKLNLEAIAEGIENPGQLALLRGLGCRLGQGYLLSLPGPARAIEALLASGARLRPPAEGQAGGAASES